MLSDITSFFLLNYVSKFNKKTERLFPVEAFATGLLTSFVLKKQIASDAVDLILANSIKFQSIILKIKL